MIDIGRIVPVRDNQKFFWNMMGSLTNALSSMILLIIVNRISGAKVGGIFSLGFATAQLMLTIGTFEVRNYQATDIKETIEFKDYFAFRICTCVVMMFASMIYIMANGYRGEKAVVIFLLCGYKMLDAFSDVFQGMFQQKDRIDLSGKALTLRILVSTIVFAIVLFFTQNIIWAIVGMIVASALSSICYDFRLLKYFAVIKKKISYQALKKIVMECIPLFMSSFLMMYIINAPKYAIDRYWGSEIQNAFSIIFMPTFVINLFTLFIFRPLLTRLAVSWEEKNRKNFLCPIYKSLLRVLLFTIFCLIGTYFLGIPILSILYNVNLQPYRIELMIAMLGGSFTAFSTIFLFALTVIRKQYIALLGYFIACISTVILSSVLVKMYGMLGASISYAMSIFIMVIIFAMVLCWEVKKAGE